MSLPPIPLAGHNVAEDFARDGVNTPPGLPRWALTLWIWKLRLQRLVLVLLGTALVLMVFAGVISRYLLNYSIFWIEEAVTYSALALYFVGAIHGTWERGHISAGLVEVIFTRERVHQALGVLASALSAALAGWMAVWAWDYLQFVIRRGTVSLEIGIPMSWVVAILPTSLALMCLYFIIETALKLRQLLVGRTLA
ncbi:MAG: TRAP transporter small permease subunit [Rhodobacteraceae bacterium]|nr:TRAP transporter small permease subunit [Paracoccaceae bacterium]